MRWKLFVGASLVGSLVLGISAACGGDDDDAAGSSNEVRVTPSDQLRFEPAEIRLKVGEPVVLTLDNSEGSTLHDFTVDEMPVMDVDEGTGAEHDMGAGAPMDMAALHLAMDPGMNGEMRFTPTEAGEYEFYCSVVGHREAGMKGKLIVE